MKLLSVLLMFFALSATAQETSLPDAVNTIRNQTVCIPYTTYYEATSTIFIQMMEIGALRAQVALLEAKLAEKK